MPFLLTLFTSLQFVHVFFYKAANPKQINAPVFKSKKDEGNLLEFPLLPWGVWRRWLARWWLSPTYCLQQDKSLSPHIKPVFKRPIVCRKRREACINVDFWKEQNILITKYLHNFHISLSFRSLCLYSSEFCTWQTPIIVITNLLGFVCIILNKLNEKHQIQVKNEYLT